MISLDFHFVLLLCFFLVGFLGWRYGTPIGNGDKWTSEEDLEELSLPFNSDNLTESQKEGRRWLVGRREVYEQWWAREMDVKLSASLPLLGHYYSASRNCHYGGHPNLCTKLRYFRGGFFVPSVEFYADLDDDVDALRENIFCLDRYYSRKLERGNCCL